MATPEDRLTAVEDAVQRMNVDLMADTDPQVVAMATLYAQMRRLQAEQAAQRGLLEEILRRFPEQP